MTPSPSSGTTGPPASQPQSLLSQWLVYTSKLTVRVAELEREVVNLRQVLSHEVLVAGVRARQAQNQNGESSGREILFPQDRYVLAGLSDGLWMRVSEALSLSAEEVMIGREENGIENEIEIEIEGGEGEGGRGRGEKRAVIKRGFGPFFSSDRDKDKERDDNNNNDQSFVDNTNDYNDQNIVSWIETTARLYRVRGHETVFVIPAWDLNPEADAVREIERGPLLMGVPKVRSAGEGTRDEWRTVGMSAHEREAEAETRRLREEIVSLKEKIDVLSGEREDERRRRRIAEERAGLVDVDGRRSGRTGEEEGGRFGTSFGGGGGGVNGVGEGGAANGFERTASEVTNRMDEINRQMGWFAKKKVSPIDEIFDRDVRSMSRNKRTGLVDFEEEDEEDESEDEEMDIGHLVMENGNRQDEEEEDEEEEEEEESLPEGAELSADYDMDVDTGNS